MGVAKKTRKRQSRSAARAKQRVTRPAPVAAPDTTASKAPTAAAPAAAETTIHPAARKPAAQPSASASAVAPAPAVQTTVPDDRPRRRAPLWPFAAVAGLIAAGILGFAILGDFDAEPMASASARPSVVVGVPGGEVVNEPTPTPDPTPTQSPDPTPSEAPADPTPTEAPATPAPTPVQVAAATPAPATPAPAATQAPSTAPPATVSVASVGSPSDAVTAFYRNVTNGNFDAAYALWSDRMKATYPRQENLDDRFANTASIDFSQLYVAEQTGTTATVQANFTETYDGGSSRQFVGYWRLIRTERGWLLDEPHY
jgi:hypothetical protein